MADEKLEGDDGAGAASDDGCWFVGRVFLDQGCGVVCVDFPFVVVVLGSGEV
jgi:hypothetical protein